MKYKIVNRRKLWATRVADAVGSVLFGYRRLRPRGPIERETVREILVIRTAYVGDVVMTLPLLKPLKEGFPGARVSFLTAARAAEILAGNPWVDEVISFNPFWFYRGAGTGEYRRLLSGLRKRRFDLVIEARGDIREILLLVHPLRARYRVSYGVGGGACLLTHVVPYRGISHKIEYHLDLARYLGCPVNGLEWGVHLAAEEKAGVRQLLADHGVSAPFAVVHPGSRLPLKQWRPEGYAAVIDWLQAEYGMQVLLLGAGSDAAMVEAVRRQATRPPVVLRRPISLRELAGLLAESALCVCNDSAPMHIAAAMGTPTVGLFGPSKSVETGPRGARCRTAEKDVPCRTTCDESVCRNPDFHACMNALMPEDVFAAIRAVRSP